MRLVDDALLHSERFLDGYSQSEAKLRNVIDDIIFIRDYIRVIRYESYNMTHHSGLFNSGSAPQFAIFE